MSPCGRGEQAVDDRQRVGDIHSSPLVSDVCIYGDDVILVGELQAGQPVFEPVCPSTVLPAQPFDALANLTDGESADEDLR
jgi:hypothetical protein